MTGIEIVEYRPELGLYRSFGFRTVEPAEPSPYARADVAMELML
jgi:hypothetical protein